MTGNVFAQGGFIPSPGPNSPAPGAPVVAPPVQPDPYGGETATLVPGRLRGYRSWRASWPQIRVTLNDRDPYVLPPSVRLEGITAPAEWRSGAPPVAVCRRAALVAAGRYTLKEGESVEHPAGAPVPARGCSCGYYALHLPNAWPLHGVTCSCHNCARDPRVFGVVEGWGRVEIGSNGWRAQYAQVAALCLPRPQSTRRQWEMSVTFGSAASVTYSNIFVDVPDPAAERIYQERWHALDRAFSVPIFENWADLVSAFPPISLDAIRAARKSSTQSAGSD